MDRAGSDDGIEFIIRFVNIVGSTEDGEFENPTKSCCCHRVVIPDIQATELAAKGTILVVDSVGLIFELLDHSLKRLDFGGDRSFALVVSDELCF